MSSNHNYENIYIDSMGRYSEGPYQRSKQDQQIDHIAYLEKKVETLQNKLYRYEEIIKENEKLKERIKDMENGRRRDD